MSSTQPPVTNRKAVGIDLGTTFSAIVNPAAGSGAIQGAATVIASNPAAGKRCYVSAWAVTS